MSMDLNAAGAKFVAGDGGGTGSGDTFIQYARDLLVEAGIGGTADAAWGGSGAASVIALLKLLHNDFGRGAVSDGSGTITAGGTAQNLFGGATPANGYLVQNLSTGDLWINDLGTASAGAGSIRLPQGGSMWITPSAYKPTGAVSLFGATTAQVFTARRW